jgi:anti-sigma B factor antagonist
MEVSREEKGPVTVVSLKGEVDMRNSPKLRGELQELSKARAPHVAVNLELVRYIDSSGIATLVEFLKNISHYGGKLTLIGVNEDIYPVFELAHLHEVFDIRRDASIG